MTNPEYVEPDTRSSRTWKDVLVEDRWRILSVLLVAGGVLVYLGYDLSVPRWLRLFLITAGIGVALGYAPASRLVAWLYRPGYTYLLDVDARTDEFAVWQLPPDTWRDLRVEDGELYQVKATVPAWECRGYDPEENVAVGTWRGSASDLELIEDRERIDEVRGVLEDLAKEGLTIRVKQSGIVRTAIRGIVMSFVEGFEKETLYEGEQIEEAVEKALARWEFDGDRDDGDEPAPGDDGSLTEENVGKPETNGHAEPATDGGTDA
mgnify:CR=1 FL=1